MSDKYRLSPASRLDLIGIEDWTLEHFGLEQALSIADQFTSAFGTLAGNSGLGHIREDLSPPGRGIKYWTVLRRFMVVYEEKGDHIHVVRVLNGSQDLRTILDDHHGSG